MKTSEQIADEIMLERGGFRSLPAINMRGASRQDVRDAIRDAIETDRKQLAENTLTIQLDDEHRPEEVVAEVLRWIEQGMTSGYYPMWEMNYIAPEGD